MAYGERYYNRAASGVTDRFGTIPSLTAGPFGSNVNVMPVTGTNGYFTSTTQNNNLGSGRQALYDITWDSGAGHRLLSLPTNGNHMSWYNSQFIINGFSPVGSSGNPVSLGLTFAQEDDAAPNAAASNLTTTNSQNYYNCLIYFKGIASTTYDPGFILDWAQDSTIFCDVRSTGAPSPIEGYGGRVYIRGAGSIIDTTLRSTVVLNSTGTLPENVSRYGRLVFRSGIYTELRNIIFDNFALSNQQQNASLLINTPNFINNQQTVYFGINTPANNKSTSNLQQRDVSDRGYFIVGPFFWATIANTMTASHAIASRFRWGGDGTGGRGQHFIQCTGFDPTWYSDANQTTAADGIILYAKSNAPTNDFTSASFFTRMSSGNQLANTGAFGLAANTTGNTHINKMISNSSGKMESFQYSMDNGNNYSTGFINWTQWDTNSTVGTTNTATNAVSQKVPDGTVILPIQVAVKNDELSNDTQAVAMQGAAGLIAEYDVRSFVYESAIDNVQYVDTSAGTGQTSLTDGSNPIDKRNITKPEDARILSKHITTTGTHPKIQRTALDNLLAGSNYNASPNDVYAVHKWLWSDDDVDRPPVFVDATSIARVEQTSNTNLFNVEIESASYISSFARTGSTLNIKSPADTFGPNDGDIVQGLHCSSLNMNGNPINGGAYQFSVLSNPVVNTTQGGPAAVSNASIGGLILANAGPNLSDNRYLVLSNCTVLPGTTLTINRTGGSGGTLFVEGAPPGTVLGTGVQVAPAVFLNYVNDTAATVYYAWGLNNSTSRPNTGSIAPNGNLSITTSSTHGGSTIANTNVIRVRFSAAGYDELPAQNTTQTVVSSTTGTTFNLSTLVSASPSYNSSATTTGTLTPQRNKGAISSSTLTLSGVTYTVPTTSNLAVTDVSRLLVLSQFDSGNQIQNGDVATVKALYDIKGSQAYAEVLWETQTLNRISAIDSATPSMDDTRIVFLPNDTLPQYLTGVSRVSTDIGTLTAGAKIAEISLQRNVRGISGPTTTTTGGLIGSSLFVADNSVFSTTGGQAIVNNSVLFNYTGLTAGLLNGISGQGSFTFAAGQTLQPVTTHLVEVENRDRTAGISAGSLVVSISNLDPAESAELTAVQTAILNAITSTQTALTTEINANETKLDTAITDIGAVRTAVNDAATLINNNINENETKIDTVITDIQTNETKIDTLTTNVATVDSVVDNINANLGDPAGNATVAGLVEAINVNAGSDHPVTLTMIDQDLVTLKRVANYLVDPDSLNRLVNDDFDKTLPEGSGFPNVE